VEFVKQENVPALLDNSARIAINEDGLIKTKPHGHGDVHSLMHDSGIAARWLGLGKRWLVMLQDTNALAMKAIPTMLGVSASRNLEVNHLCVPKKPGQPMGALAKLIKEDGSVLNINVEYNHLDALLRAKWNPAGDVCIPGQEHSKFPGFAGVFVLSLPEYVETLSKTSGLMPEFVNPKYSDASRVSFKAPTRLESIYSDYPRLLADTSRVSFTMLETWFCFSPCKNNINDAIECYKKRLPTFGAA